MASSSAPPRLVLLLTPVVNNTNEITELAGTISIPAPSIERGSILTYTKNSSNGTGSSLKAIDHAGSLPLSHSPGQSDPHLDEWRVNRQTTGDVNLHFSASGATVKDSSVDKAALRQDQGGLIGIGKGFLPRIAVPDATYSIQVKWDLEKSPAGTQVVWTHGEGPEPSPIIGSLSLLSEAVYMAGPIQSVRYEIQEENPDQGSGEDTCACYWLGTLPPNVDDIKDFNIKMFPRLSPFFRNSAGSYRAFFRKVPKGFGAQVVKNSSLIDYDDDTKNESDWELARLLNRSMISSWAQLDPEDDGTKNDWFSKGLASLYSIYLPYRFGQRTPDYFRATLNGYFTGYFTNPLIERALGELPAEREDWYAESIPWLRGCVFMTRMDVRMRRASISQEAGVLRPIDEIVAEISQRRSKGEKVQAKDWIEYVGHWIGEDEARKDLQNMIAGTRLYMDDMETIFEGIDPETQQVLDFGFDRASLDAGVVSGVTEGPKAAEAGLKNGDNIKWYSRPWLCTTVHEGKFKLTVERGGETLDIEYWPRNETKARVWQSYKKERK